MRGFRPGPKQTKLYRYRRCATSLFSHMQNAGFLMMWLEIIVSIWKANVSILFGSYVIIKALYFRTKGSL